jgi:hypothetical protein
VPSFLPFFETLWGFLVFDFPPHNGVRVREKGIRNRRQKRASRATGRPAYYFLLPTKKK